MRPFYPVLRAGLILAADPLARVKGIKFPPNFSRYYKGLMLLRRFERTTVELCRDLLGPGMNVMDIGSHIGYFTLLFSELVRPAGRVYAFEPHPANYRLLCLNARRAAAGSVVPINKAVSDRVGLVNLFEAIDSGQHSLYPEAVGSATPQERPSGLIVESTTLDAFCASQPEASIDLIKVDAQGAEPAIIRGMGQLIKRSSSLNLIIEYWPEGLLLAGTSPGDFLDSLASLHFDVNVIDVAKKQLLKLRTQEIDEYLRECGGNHVNLLCQLQQRQKGGHLKSIP